MHCCGRVFERVAVLASVAYRWCDRICLESREKYHIRDTNRQKALTFNSVGFAIIFHFSLHFDACRMLYSFDIAWRQTLTIYCSMRKGPLKGSNRSHPIDWLHFQHIVANDQRFVYRNQPCTSSFFFHLAVRCWLPMEKKMPMWNMMNVAVSNRVALYRVNITNTHKQAYRIAMTCVVWWMCFRLACRNICVQSINWARAPLLDHIARLGTLDKGDARSLGYPIDTNRSGWTSHFVFASGPDRIACNFVLRTNSTATQNELLFHFLLALLNLGKDTRYLWLFCCVFVCIKWWLIFSFNPNQRFADCYLPNAHLAAFEYNIPILCIMFSSQFLHIFFYVMLCYANRYFRNGICFVLLFAFAYHQQWILL